MTQVVSFLQNLDALAFIVLGAAVAIGWARRRDASTGYLALAIVLLSLVTLLGRLPSLLGFTPPLLNEASLVAFVGCGYALLLHRASLIPLGRAWHTMALAAVVGTVGAYLVARISGGGGTKVTAAETVAGLALIAVWLVLVLEPTVRFWLVARGMPAVQAWRLRSLSLSFAGIIAILLFAAGFAFALGRTSSTAAVQIGTQLVVLLIVPLLYVSFSPPAWLRRQWRSSEEEGLRRVTQDLLLLREDRAVLTERALTIVMRLVGAGAVLALDSDGEPVASIGLAGPEASAVRDQVRDIQAGHGHVELWGADRATLTFPLNIVTGRQGRMMLIAGPFTPDFGADESRRAEQFVSALAAAFDRLNMTKRLEEANVRLLEANRHKSVFLASMSHELRTPLNAILGFSELLIDANNGKFPPATRKRFLEQIHSSGEHLLGLINDILDLSKIEAGQMELRLQSISVAEVVHQVTSTIEPLAMPKNIKVTVGSVDVGEITADAGKLKQMLLNIVSNAVKFTPEGGSVNIEARRLADTVEIAVTDTGIGIAKEDQERVFHEFQQVDEGVARSQPGTGLGLTLTRRFAKLHGGDVRIESERGKGSVFTIALPIAAHRVPAVDSVSGRTAAGDMSRPLVLVVEDDPPAAELLMRQLERAGFRTEVARSGAEALTMAKDLKPAAITLDILLPDLDGWEVLTRLKREPATSEIPVVVVSVVDNPELGMALGALDYFVKPVPAKELINRLRRFKFGRRVSERVRILVVDDESANRLWLKRILEPAGFAVIQASGGREAIELARTKKPDLVMLDLMMPEVTGFAVVEALRENDATRRIPIMVVTAKNLTEEDIRQLNGHVSTILSRGSTGASDILELLREIVESSAAG